MEPNKEVVISARNISKKFEVDFNLVRRNGIRDLFGKPPAKFEGMGAKNRITGKNFWALRDISFEVYRGETLGIIGVNGAGKTTLLKILNQILEPTTGSFDIKGRVSSLIGVGTGFHLELSGKENVYFNGALLGMTKKEITAKFDEIVEFSELGSFINTPVKYYSSGMRSRLGFSVAMNLDAEVMIIDEALAVGDINFKKKSMEKMRNTAFTGKTVLFVSHSMSVIQEVASRTLWLNDGKMMKLGQTDDVVEAYLKSAKKESGGKWTGNGKELIGDQRVAISSMHIEVDGKKSKVHAAPRGKNVVLVMDYIIDKPSKTYSIGYCMINDRGSKLFRVAFEDNTKLKSGKNRLKTRLPIEILVNGNYKIAADVDIKNDVWLINPKTTRARIPITVTGAREDDWDTNREGLTKPKVEWEHF